MKFEPEYDFVFSRFGTMFFSNPVAALRNMRSALKPGGVVTHIVWRTPDDNPWLSMAKDVVLRYLPPPGEDAQTRICLCSFPSSSSSSISWSTG